ncbi:MAG: class I adenylate-forming enzyme family protein [Acidobacteriota bacterium]|nr:class I adenylate-forming enzyme family protein [Acidobacteriota bacterium]
MVETSIHEAFLRRLNEAPEAPVAICAEREWSVGDLHRLTDALVPRLRAAGLGPGQLVSLEAPSGPGFLGAFLALRRVGCAALLLGTGLAASEAREIRRRLGTRGRLAAPPWPETVEDLELAAENPEHPADLEPDIAVVKLTSGSTGTPRGILVSGAALLADDRALASSMELRDDERILVAVPMAHSYGLASVALPALVRPSTLILPAGGNPFAALQAGHRHGATFLPTVPAYLQALLKKQEPPPWPETLRLTITAGAPLLPETARRFRQAYGRSIHVFYGSSESGGITYDRRGDAGERGSLGTPVTGVEIELEAAGGAPGGDRGLVTVRSPAVARAYLDRDTEVNGDPELPSSNLHAPNLHDGCFRTNDLAELRGGELFLLGRVDDVINIKGKKVHPREIEAVLRRQPGVDDAAVLAVERPGGGELLRAVVASTDREIDQESVQAWCRRHLAAHKVPRSLILLPALPRTDRGKLDRRALYRLEDGLSAEDQRG